jgi:hypothetical protein
MADGESHGSNGSKRLRAFVVILGVVLPFGPALVGGCGSSSAPAPMATAPTVTADATVPLVMVVTAGGGGASSSGAMIVNPFGGTSSGGSSGSSSSGSPTDSGSDDASDGGPASDASDGGSSEAATNSCPNYVAPMCGTTPCDLRANTCCVTFSLQARCIPGANAACNSNEATLHCTQGCECSGGDSCCGVENTILGVVQTECQAIPDGGLCNPHPQTTTQASAQLCKDTSECKNGLACLAQSCIYGAMLSVCGLQSQDPFDCTPQ